MPNNFTSLFHAREQSGLSLKQAAKLLGIDTETLSALERSNIEPTREKLKEMAKLYRVSYEWISGQQASIPSTIMKISARKLNNANSSDLKIIKNLLQSLNWYQN